MPSRVITSHVILPSREGVLSGRLSVDKELPGEGAVVLPAPRQEVVAAAHEQPHHDRSVGREVWTPLTTSRVPASHQTRDRGGGTVNENMVALLDIWHQRRREGQNRGAMNKKKRGFSGHPPHTETTVRTGGCRERTFFVASPWSVT